MRRKLRLARRFSDGLPCPRPEVTLRIVDQYQTFAPLRFVIDTGADVTSMPIALAQRQGIPFARSEATRGRASGLVGAVEKFRGLLHVRLFDELFAWPCDFLETPSSPSGTATHRDYVVLGRAGFLAAFNVCIREPYFTIERRLNHRPWWHRLGRALLPFPAVEHPVSVPL